MTMIYTTKCLMKRNSISTLLADRHFHHPWNLIMNVRIIRVMNILYNIIVHSTQETGFTNVCRLWEWITMFPKTKWLKSTKRPDQNIMDIADFYQLTMIPGEHLDNKYDFPIHKTRFLSINKERYYLELLVNFWLKILKEKRIKWTTLLITLENRLSHFKLLFCNMFLYIYL